MPITAGKLAPGPERLELIRKSWTHSGSGAARALPEPNVRRALGLGDNQWGKNNELQVGGGGVVVGVRGCAKDGVVGRL